MLQDNWSVFATTTETDIEFNTPFRSPRGQLTFTEFEILFFECYLEIENRNI